MIDVDINQVPLSRSELSAFKHSYHAEILIVKTVQVYLAGQGKLRANGILLLCGLTAGREHNR